jgi:hypothetical protein
MTLKSIAPTIDTTKKSEEKIAREPRTSKRNEELYQMVFEGKQTFLTYLKSTLDKKMTMMKNTNRTNYYEEIQHDIIPFDQWQTWWYGKQIRILDTSDSKVDPYTIRSNTIYKEFGISRPFFDIQKYCYDKGFKLLDISDHRIGGRNLKVFLATLDTFIVQEIVEGQPINEKQKLWHRLNKLYCIPSILDADLALVNQTEEVNLDEQDKADNSDFEEEPESDED